MTRLDDIKARHAKATPGPWERDPWEADAEGAVLWNIPAEDWEFVSHCPDDVGWLLDRVTRLTEALELIAGKPAAELKAYHNMGNLLPGDPMRGIPTSFAGLRKIARAALDTEQP